MDVVEKLRTIINKYSRNRSKISAVILQSLKEVIQNYKLTSDDRRDKIRKELTQNERRSLLMISDYCASIAINNKDEEMLQTAVILHSIEDFEWDPRENIIRFSILWHISEELKNDSVQLFHNAASISSPKGSEYFNEFLNRSKKMKSLKAMGLSVISDGNRISFAPIPPPWERKS